MFIITIQNRISSLISFMFIFMNVMLIKHLLALLNIKLQYMFINP